MPSADPPSTSGPPKAPRGGGWFAAASYDPAQLVTAKAGQRVSVCLPAHNEADTVGDIVLAIRRSLMDTTPLVDEILVIDDGSSDATATVAAAAGARVEASGAILPAEGSRRGKGEALWKSVAASDGDLIVWLDADLTSFEPAFVTGLLGPLLTRPGIVFVKGFYERPGNGADVGGGRVTELVARPLLATWFPELSGIVQPIGGEYAARREAVERVRFAGGYGVDIGLLIDVARGWGVDAIAQVDLGVRNHRNRPLLQLGPQALAVMTTALRRAGLDVSETPLLRQPDGVVTPVDARDRPPLVDVAGYRHRPEATDADPAPRRRPTIGDQRLAELAHALGDVPTEEAADLLAGTDDEDPLRRVARAIVKHRHRSGGGA